MSSLAGYTARARPRRTSAIASSRVMTGTLVGQRRWVPASPRQKTTGSPGPEVPVARHAVVSASTSASERPESEGAAITLTIVWSTVACSGEGRVNAVLRHPGVHGQSAERELVDAVNHAVEERGSQRSFDVAALGRGVGAQCLVYAPVLRCDTRVGEYLVNLKVVSGRFRRRVGVELPAAAVRAASGPTLAHQPCVVAAVSAHHRHELVDGQPAAFVVRCVVGCPVLSCTSVVEHAGPVGLVHGVLPGPDRDPDPAPVVDAVKDVAPRSAWAAGSVRRLQLAGRPP